ncbi:MAG: DNA polymerase/3'-5' exonuclease PolX [Acidimicrobiia bacterium]|nr:MAG: DNA polymerase/3'-5' exonuclease PolX [Acidimicrobiia bacterium]
MAKPSNREITAMLRELAELTTLEEENPNAFRVRAFENAVAGIEGHGADVADLDLEELTRIKGVGRSIAELIREFVETGRVARLEELRAKYPRSFVELTRVPGLGPKRAKLLRRELGVEDLTGLRKAIEEQRIRTLPGMGRTIEEKLGRAIERLGLEERRVPIAVALPLAERLVERISSLGVEHAAYCGSLRRFKETIGDIDITVAASDPEPVMSEVVSHPDTEEVIARGDTKTSIRTRDGIQVDVRVVEPDQLGAALLYFTGSKSHNVALRQLAIERGWLLNEYGLVEKESGRVIARRTEEEIYRALGLQFIPPTLRENSGEIEAAARGELPRVVELEDMRGDLHVHTTRSGDGRSTVADMLGEAARRGYSYVAITDHGENLAINGSTRDQMRQHRLEVEEEASRFPRLRVLFGAELNIGEDGSLDYDPEFRAETFQWCVASVHSHFDLPQARQTERLLTAIADPTVSAIGHLTGRYIGRRPGIEIDVDAVLDALRDTGTALEVNGALDRLDAPSEVVRRAVARGVDLVISTDAHHTSELDRMRFGVLNAQRGWATPDRVVNTRPWDEFSAWLGL